ncbi:MAG: recombination mediator RecR [Bacilli bacterium]
MYPDSLKNLVESFKYFPGIGERTAERLAFALFALDNEKTNLFIESIKDVKTKIHCCPICGNLTENETCSICQDTNRDSSTLCVVEDIKSVFLFENLGSYHGVYHVLKGLISPLDGINPEDIGLDKLIDRIQQSNFKEMILAFKPSIEGETTALYLTKIIDGMNIKVSRLARGIPMGADMEYIDQLTLERAFQDRRQLS